MATVLSPFKQAIVRAWWQARPRVALSVVRDGDAVLVRDASHSLRILSEPRARLYKRGIRIRLRRLAAAYGVPAYVSIRPGDTVVDVGANVGEFSIYAAERGARVIAIEPDAYTFQCLEQNCRSIESIELIRAAIWETDARRLFNVDPDEANGSLVNQGPGSGDWMETKRLDTLLSSHSIGTIRLIKADVEGAEPELLKGASETLKKTEYISMDCGMERQGHQTSDTCAEILRGLGFRIVRQQRRYRWNLIGANSSLS